jgi:adenylate cyclase, class 2
MKEIEVKVLEINKEKVLQKLKELKAEFVGEWDIDSIIFDDENNSLSKKKNLLRLRKKGKNYLTFKGKEKDGFAREAEEIEIEVSDFEKMKLILSKIGFTNSINSEKHRTTYKLKNSLIEIDEIKGIPTFLEVESPNEKEIKEIIELFGFENDKIKNWNGFKLLEYYGVKI